jgi:hypothetical protein
LTYILGIDPGLATGMAVYDLETCKVIRAIEAPKGIKGFTQPFLMLRTTGHEHATRKVLVACEGFTLRSSNKFTADLSGVEIIGWLKGEEYCETFPEPVQHMTITRLRKNKDDYKKSVITKMMKDAKFPIGAGHNRMALSVAVWYAAMVLKHRPTLELLSGREK